MNKFALTGLISTLTLVTSTTFPEFAKKPQLKPQEFKLSEQTIWNADNKKTFRVNAKSFYVLNAARYLDRFFGDTSKHTEYMEKANKIGKPQKNIPSMIMSSSNLFNFFVPCPLKPKTHIRVSKRDIACLLPFIQYTQITKSKCTIMLNNKPRHIDRSIAHIIYELAHEKTR